MQHAQLVQIQRHQNAAGNQPSKLSRSTTVSCPSPSHGPPFPQPPPFHLPPFHRFAVSCTHVTNTLPLISLAQPNPRRLGAPGPRKLHNGSGPTTISTPRRGGACGVERGNKTSRLGNGWKGEGGEDGLRGGSMHQVPSTKHQAPTAGAAGDRPRKKKTRKKKKKVLINWGFGVGVCDETRQRSRHERHSTLAKSFWRPSHAHGETIPIQSGKAPHRPFSFFFFFVTNRAMVPRSRSNPFVFDLCPCVPCKGARTATKKKKSFLVSNSTHFSISKVQPSPKDSHLANPISTQKNVWPRSSTAQNPASGPAGGGEWTGRKPGNVRLWFRGTKQASPGLHMAATHCRLQREKVCAVI